jgi:hypothetical protein
VYNETKKLLQSMMRNDNFVTNEPFIL